MEVSPHFLRRSLTEMLLKPFKMLQRDGCFVEGITDFTLWAVRRPFHPFQAVMATEAFTMENTENKSF